MTSCSPTSWLITLITKTSSNNCLFEITIRSTQYLFSDWPKEYSEFRNQCLGRHLAADYTIIMSRTLNVTGNHVMYDRGTWFLRVIMSSSRALCCLPSVKKQKHDFQVCFVDLARHRKSSWRQGQVDEGGKGAVCWLREREKTERTSGKERVGTNILRKRERKDSFNV